VRPVSQREGYAGARALGGLKSPMRNRSTRLRDPGGPGWPNGIGYTCSPSQRVAPEQPAYATPPMPWPPEYQRASLDFEKFMVVARDAAGLATTNMAWNMVVGVLLAFRRRMSVDQVLRLADQLPPVVRALFLDHWNPCEPVVPVGTREVLLEEVRSVRPDHNFATASALESVGQALRAVLPDDAFTRLLDTLPPDLRGYWSTDLPASLSRSTPPDEAKTNALDSQGEQ
jgi:uncharacterized protein (DUF2267 family)